MEFLPRKDRLILSSLKFEKNLKWNYYEKWTNILWRQTTENIFLDIVRNVYKHMLNNIGNFKVSFTASGRMIFEIIHLIFLKFIFYWDNNGFNIL